MTVQILYLEKLPQALQNVRRFEAGVLPEDLVGQDGPIGPPHEIPSVEHDLGALASPNLGNRVTVFRARHQGRKTAAT